MQTENRTSPLRQVPGRWSAADDEPIWLALTWPGLAASGTVEDVARFLFRVRGAAEPVAVAS